MKITLDILYEYMVADFTDIYFGYIVTGLQILTFAVQSTSYTVTSRKFTMYLNCTVYKAFAHISKDS